MAVEAVGLVTDLVDRPVPEPTPLRPLTLARAPLVEDSRLPVAPATPRPSRQREVVAVVGQGLTIFAAVVLLYVGYLGGISALEHGRDQRGLSNRFASYLGGGQAWIGGVIPEGEPVALLEIPVLGVHEVVVEGTSSSLLRQGPGHLRSAPLPGQPGNAVVAGRRVAYGGPFRHLDRLKAGDEITATTGQGMAKYVVTEVKEVSRAAPDVLDDFGDARLTLVTSAPMLRAERRLVAIAELRSPVRAAPAARPANLRTDELGLQGDRAGAFALLLWAQALLVAALGAAWLRRRWRRWPTYLLAVPVLAVLVLLVFDSFTPILPSTM